MRSPRFASQTIEGTFTSNSAADRAYVSGRTRKCIDIARVLSCKAIVRWLSRKGTYMGEAKDARLAYQRLLKVLIGMLDYDLMIEIWFEPKPNEPTD